MSKSGGGGGPLRGSWRLDLGSWLEASEVVESLLPGADVDLRRSSAVLERGVPALLGGRLMLGSTRRFCLLGGRISSRSTGTPRDTRKRRRMRDLVQFGGCKGGGATSCCQRERLRSERKDVSFSLAGADGCSEGGGASGNMEVT